MRSLGIDLVAALQHLHSRGFLHNDLKPSNVLLDEQGRVKLAGLGLARPFTDTQASSQVCKEPRSAAWAYSADERTCDEWLQLPSWTQGWTHVPCTPLQEQGVQAMYAGCQILVLLALIRSYCG